MSASADRQLLFGILALQMDFVTRDQLVVAMNAWVLEKTKPLSDMLAVQGILSLERVELLTALMAEHLKQHDHDAKKSLAALSSVTPALIQQLAAIPDADVQASVGMLTTLSPRAGDDPNAPCAQPTVGASNFDGRRYRILRPHAEGGLGKVYIAEDGELHREVALKEIKDRFADHPDSRARFVVEAEITGRLEHPGIVPVYGLGAYADGRPFYAMRFIHGDSLKEAIIGFHASDSHKFDSLEFRQLLGRFVDVCQAVAYAHSRKVLHRDLKPDNIMLGKYGETLVLDWGLAKTLVRAGSVSEVSGEPPLTPASGSGTGETLPGDTIGTPQFMSPEQAAGQLDLIGPATDTYSLGATLYAVLTGRAPFDGANVAEVLHNVERGEYPSARQVNPNVPPALSNICGKAMALKPADRYASALDLAADVEHWLSDEPVTAWHEPVSVRAWRWVRRHRTLATTVAALMLATAAGLGLLALEKERARLAVANEQAETAKERDVAREQKRRTRAALDTMLSPDMVERLGAQKELTKGQRQFLQTALGYYKEFAADAPTDEEGRSLEAAANFRVGDLLQSLGQKEDAVAAYRRALSNYSGLNTEFPAKPEYRHNEAACHNYLGSLHTSLGRSVAAEADLRAARSTLESLAADFPAVPEYRRDLGQCRINLGVLFFELAKYPAAKAEYEAALAVQAKLVTDFPSVPDYRSVVATTHNNLANVLARLNQRTAAESHYRLAASMKEKLAAEYPAVPKYRNEAAATHNNLGALYRLLRRFPAAEAEERAAIVIQENLVAEFPAVPSYAVELCGSYLNLGNVLFDKGDAAAALVWHAKAIDRAGPIVAAEPRLATARQFLRNAHEGRAGDLAQLKRYADAISDWDAALKLDDGAHRFAIRTGRAECLARTGQAAEAVREASELAADPAANVDSIYNCACFASLAAAVPNNTDANTHAAKAVELLRHAFAQGYTDIPYLLADADLAPLRGRADYADLLWDIADRPVQTKP